MDPVSNVRHRGVPAVTALTIAFLLAGCSSGSGTSGAVAASSPGVAASSPPVSESSAPAQTVAIGATATLPTDTITVASFLDNAAPKATKPGDVPTAHWASAAVKQCATAASGQGRWELALTDGTTAPEAASWVEGELPHQLQPSRDALAAGDCVSGNVYFEMPDGAKATGVVLKPSVASPSRPQVTWTIA
jgi:hypothetical protein